MAAPHVELALFMLRMYTALSSWMESTWIILQKMYSAVKGVFDDELYLFFADTAFAYPSRKVVTWTASSARPSWLYNATEGCFHEWCGSLISTRVKGEYKSTLPYLSLEIMEGEHVAYDLTDFIERLTVYREDEEEMYPTVEQVVAAWSTGSNILVDEKRHHLRMMDTSAETIERGFHEGIAAAEEGSDDDVPIAWPPTSRPVVAATPSEDELNPVTDTVPPACGSTA